MITALPALALLLAPPVAETALRALAEQDALVARVGHRLATVNAARCSRRMSASGMVLHGLEQYGGGQASTAASLFSLGDAPGVLAVVPGSPADMAGVKSGDAILAVNGMATPEVRMGGKPFDRMGAMLDAMESALAAGPAVLDIARGQERLKLRFAGAQACATRFQVDPSPRLNARADGKYVEITTGLMTTVANEDELAAVLAHELAHNILDHRAVLNEQGISRGLLGRVGRNARRIRETEIAADRFSLLLMRDAGYRMAAAPEFWEHFEKRHGHGILADATHLNGRHRVDMLRAEIAAIDAQ
jgi:hypothetical protein